MSQVAKCSFVPTAFIVFCLVTISQCPAQKLSQEGQLRKAAHDFLFQQFATSRDCKYTSNGNILSEIVVTQQRIEANGQLIIEFPEGSQRVAGMFRHLALKGEHLDRIGDLKLLPYKPDSTLHHSQHTPDFYRVQIGALPLPEPTAPRITLQADTSGPVVVTAVVFSSQNKLPTKFDDLPYRNLGDEQPTVEVPVHIDTACELSIEGIVDLQHDKFFRYYATPGGVHPSLEKWAHERGFRPGRQITKMQYALVQGYSSSQPKLRESSTEQGHADLSFFDRYDSSPRAKFAIEPFRQIDYAMCLDNWPDFMSIPHVGRGTPKVEHFDAAAELAGAFVADQIQDGGRTATWWEVKNESTIKSEWDYHWAENSWPLLADFHNRVADEIHRHSPNTKVGGPSSAWMQLQVNDFGLYRSQRDFMDLTKDKLDFYSHHFYEDFATLGAWHRRESTYSNYLLGRLEAILDMLQAHMRGTDNQKPILITECGSLQPGRGPSDYWLRLRSFSAYMHKFLNRPSEIDLCVPFVFLNVPWNPGSGNAAFIPKEGHSKNGPIEGYAQTPVTHFFDLWRDFQGRRLHIEHDRQWLDVTALHKGNTIYLAMTNMSGQRLNVNLSGISQDSNASASQRRLFYRDSTLQYRDQEQLTDLTAIDVEVEETTLVLIKLKAPLRITNTLRRDFSFAPETAVAAKQATAFEIEIDPTADIQSAQLVIGVHRAGGLDAPLVGAFNGQPFRLDADWASETKNLFAPLALEIDATQLQDINQVDLNPVTGMTITSVKLQLDRKRSED
ncbi:MAG: beta-agarase [Planctomycetota bacterium]